MTTRMILIMLTCLITLLTSTLAVNHDTFKRTTCYCANKPDAPHPFIGNLRYKRYYSAALNEAFIINDTCLDNSPSRRFCLPYVNRGEGKCVFYTARTTDEDGTPRLNHLCYNSLTEWEEIMDNNFSAQFGFNGQWRRLGHGKYGSPATEEMNADVVQNTCEPLCEEHFGGVPMQPLYAGKGRVVASYDQVFRGFEDIVSCDGCTETRVPDKV